MAIAARPSKLPAQIAFVDIGYSPLVLIAPTIQCPITEKLATVAKLLIGMSLNL